MIQSAQDLANAVDRQVGGNHYKAMPIQVTEFCQRNRLNFCEGNAVKYICRHKLKGQAQDIKKAIHYLEVLLELEYSLHSLDGRVTLEHIARLAIQAHDANERYCAHAEDAEGCGYANDPTGSLHVTGSYNRMSERAEQLRTAIEAFKLQAPIAELRHGGSAPLPPVTGSQDLIK